MTKRVLRGGDTGTNSPLFRMEESLADKAESGELDDDGAPQSPALFDLTGHLAAWRQHLHIMRGHPAS